MDPRKVRDAAARHFSKPVPRLEGDGRPDPSDLIAAGKFMEAMNVYREIRRECPDDAKLQAFIKERITFCRNKLKEGAMKKS